MIMLSIIAMTVIVFLSRYLFLEPKLPLKLNNSAVRLLSYSSPAVLTAILAPIILLPEGELFAYSGSPYIIGAVVTAILIWKTGSVLWSIIVSTSVFLYLNLLVYV